MRWFWIGLTGVAVVAAGCAGTSGSGVGAAGGVSGRSTDQSRFTAPLNDRVIKNATFFSQAGSGGVVQLHEGKTDPRGSGDNSKSYLLGDPTYGYLDADDIKDAAVVLVTDSGMDRIYYELFAVLNQDGNANPIGSVVLGDRVRVNSVGILNRKIFVDVVRQGPNDMVTSPSMRAKESYQVQGGSLVRVSQVLLTH